MHPAQVYFPISASAKRGFQGWLRRRRSVTCGLTLEENYGIIVRLCLLFLVFAGFNSLFCYGADVQPAPGTMLSAPRVTTAQEIRLLTAENANRAYQAHLRGVVTYVDPAWSLLFVQDLTAGIYVSPNFENVSIAKGQEVEIEGVSGAGNYTPVIMAPKITILGPGKMPDERKVSYEELLSGREDSQWVSVSGLVRSISRATGHLMLGLFFEGGRTINLHIPFGDTNALPENLLNAQVTVKGVCGVLVNQRHQAIGAQIFVPSLEEIHMDVPPSSNIFELSAQPIARLPQLSSSLSSNRWTKVQGVVILQSSNHGLFIKDPTGELNVRVRFDSPDALAPGDLIEAVGLPRTINTSSVLDDAKVRKIRPGAAIKPTPIDPARASSGAFDNKLVSLEGILLDKLPGAREQTLLLHQDDSIFLAFIDAENVSAYEPMLTIGNHLQLAGICQTQANDARPSRSFRILVLPSGGVAVLKAVPWWNSRQMLFGLAGLGLFSAAALLWVVALRKQVREKTHLIRMRLENEAAVERNYRELVENASDIIYTRDLSGRILSMNRAGQRAFGYTMEEVLRMTAEDLIAPEYHPQVWDTTARAAAGVPLEARECEFVTKAKSTIVVEVSLSPIYKDGKVAGVQAIARDITARKQAEMRNMAFSLLSQRLSAATEQKEAAGIIADVADDLIGWDAFAAHMYSVAEDKVRTLLCIDCVNGKRIEANPARLGVVPSASGRRVLEQGPYLQSHDDPSAVSFSDANRAPASSLFVQICNREKVIGFLVIQSYTPEAYTEENLQTLQALAHLCGGALERIHAEEALRQSEQKFRKLVDQAVDAFFVHTPNGKFLDVNQRACESLGFGREELLNLSVADIEEGRESGKEDGWSDSLSKGPITLERRLRRKDGSTFPVEIRTGEIHSGKEPLVLALVRDISDRNRLEEQLRHAQRLESVGRLAAGVAHDFNNLLTVLQGYVTLLQARQDLDPELKEPVDQISDAAQRAASLTRQLLAFSRKQVMQPRPLNLSAVVEGMTKILRRLLPENIELRIQCPPSLPNVYADPGMMEQIVMNLAVNARDAVEKQGCITISTQLIEIDANYVTAHPEATIGRYISLSVQDNGSGIDEATYARLFEPFFTTKETGKGTGLGLSTVYGIVKQHQGWIDVSSSLGRGSEFTVFLPVSASTESEEPQEKVITPVPSADRTARKATILLVEDEPVVLRLAKRLLEREGYKILEATSGPEAVSIWNDRSNEIDVLLTDMVMPGGIGGFELAKQLLATKPSLKVIYTSGYSPDLFSREFQSQETIYFLPKPYRPSKLMEMVSHVINL